MPAHEIAMSVLVGSAVASIAWIVLSVLTAARVVPAALGRFEEGRREQLRAASTTYRLAEPWIDELIRLGSDLMEGGVALLKKNLPATGNRTPWHAEEYLATKLVEGILLGAGVLVIALIVWPPFNAVFASIAFGALYVWLMIHEVKSCATRRRNKIRRRFTSTFDLVSLMLAVGANFQEAVATVAEESDGHPLGEELERMLQDTEMGGMRNESLQAFSDRIADDDIAEMMTGVIEAEKLGTPMADIMQTQVEQMRQKRTQWAEKESEESKVRLVFPAMVIMIACLIIVAAPFILDAVLSS